jgi:rubredoxin
MADTYVCENCKLTYTKTRTDAETTAEAEAIFGPKPDDPDVSVLVCPSCYELIMANAYALGLPMTWIEPTE